jgi:hypothetical protein
MRKQYDFSKAKRAKSVPHLAKLQAEAKGKTRITIQAIGATPVDEATLRRVIREELKAG